MNKFIKVLQKKRERLTADKQRQTEAQMEKQAGSNTKKSVRGYISNALMENGHYPEWSWPIQKLSQGCSLQKVSHSEWAKELRKIYLQRPYWVSGVTNMYKRVLTEESEREKKACWKERWREENKKGLSCLQVETLLFHLSEKAVRFGPPLGWAELRRRITSTQVKRFDASRSSNEVGGLEAGGSSFLSGEFSS